MKKALLATLLAAISWTAVAAENILKSQDMVAYRADSVCARTCHMAGVYGAPRAFDADAWKPRLAKGMDKLVASVKNGFKAMPPQRGGCSDCTDADYEALIDYLSSPKMK